MTSRTLICILLGLAGLVASARYWLVSQPPTGNGFLVYHGNLLVRPITVPTAPTEGHLAAARLLSNTLATAASLPASYFPVWDEAAWRGPSIRIGVREPSPKRNPAKTDMPTIEAVGYDVYPEGIRIHAENEDTLISAASWFLEQTVGARWFSPGRMGFEVTQRGRLVLPLGRRQHAPGYFSRNFGGLDKPTEKAWYRANRLVSRLDHGHTVSSLISQKDLAANPAMAPVVNGLRYIPRDKHDDAWQPDLTSPATLRHVTRALRDQLSRDPSKMSVVFGQNDSWRWDQGSATLAVVAPHRYFRGYPDYSNTLFAFLNKAAEGLAPEFPDRFLSTYAYQWTEDVPRFPVHPMVLPYLTADRSQWFDPAFAKNDKDLLQRWGKAGLRIFGIYDYYYGGPFLVPRPTLYAVAESIPFAHAAGVRAFYAECYPNWGLDGPKLWLAAQLLWDPTQDSAQLLNEYYSRYWKEAAGPMRRFFEVCERQWLNQPKPGYWIKYFKDDHQRILYPPEVRRELWEILDRASAVAKSEIVRERLALVRAAFSVSDLFCLHDEKRETLARLTLRSDSATDDLVRVIGGFSKVRRDLKTRHAEVKRRFPLALSAELIGDYMRTDPRPRALAELARRGVHPHIDDDLRMTVFAGTAPTATELAATGTEILKDGNLATLRKRNAHPFTLLDWNEPGSPWTGKGEPFETRQIELRASPQGGQVLRLAGCNQEALMQWQPAEPGAFYHATVRVRGKVSPGNMTFLLVMFANADGKTTDMGHTDRLPIGEFIQTTSLEILARAPKNATWVGVSIRALWQVNDDYVEIEDISLKRLQ